ncbi:hypothetical protein [Cellulomonas wangsupingiae]|uniref:Uncharacterized protein n=1 Tax=Cellulomonas wangsupingiae TaxID=2968085 RepID=A0ABY5K6U0_9CELL|nr:hypothetical protein [Cellulomonas wangsupingiae]MCC2334397.1 hypothetical protein [Cellulomonas wangsupingiae]UUI66065.1 hypothetical protein NP075_04880 [Cellulomonas wangsupingiae]
MNALVATVLIAGARWSERLPGPTIESPEEGSPGFEGFVATFLLAAAVIALAVSFTRRMRRADHRDRLRDDADVAGAGASDGVPDAAPGTRPAVTGGEPASGGASTDDAGGPPR